MSTACRRFAGTENPRLLRAVLELLRRNLWREEVDSVAGASNGPDVVAQLRRKGLELPCEMVSLTDRDGRLVRAGMYSLTDADRRLFYRWLSNRIKGNSLGP